MALVKTSWMPYKPLTDSISLSNSCKHKAKPHATSTLPFGSHPHTGTPCDQVARFLPAAPSPTQLSLLPSNGTVYLRYGQPSSFYLGACKNGSDNATCGAVAWQAPPVPAGGNLTGGNWTDLSASIVVQDTTQCTGGQVGLLEFSGELRVFCCLGATGVQGV